MGDDDDDDENEKKEGDIFEWRVEVTKMMATLIERARERGGGGEGEMNELNGRRENEDESLLTSLLLTLKQLLLFERFISIRGTDKNRKRVRR